MATGFSDIITRAMKIIDDVRWQEDLDTNPALFLREKTDWVLQALASLNRPPELGEYLTQTMVEPSYADASWTSTEASMSDETTVATGKTGFDLCSVCVYDSTGTKLIPYPDANCDAATGNVTFPVQSAAGIKYTIDFYTDGTFGTQNKALTIRQMELFSLAVAIVWDQRMDRNWLNIQAKVHDSSFNPPSEGTYTEKINQRLMRNIQMFNDKCTKYEQDCAFINRRGRISRMTLI